MRDPDESPTMLEGAPLDREAVRELTSGFVLAGRYEVQKTLGRGGMGVVVRAFDRAGGVPGDISEGASRPVGLSRWRSDA